MRSDRIQRRPNIIICAAAGLLAIAPAMSARAADAISSPPASVASSPRVLPVQLGVGQSRVVEGAPTWPELPPETQRALIRLMARLLLEHAEKCQAALPMGAGHDL